MGDNLLIVEEASNTIGFPSTGHVPTENASDLGTNLGGGLPSEIMSNTNTSSISKLPSAGHIPDFTSNSDTTLGGGEHILSISASDAVYGAVDTSNSFDVNINGAICSKEEASHGAFEAATNHTVAGAEESLVIHENMGVNYYQSAGVIGNGSIPNEEGVPVVEQQPGQVYSVEEERLWNMVRSNCLDFNSWTALIEETEKVAENNLLKIKKVYDAFLAEFPLCFGYWKKYADHEGRWSSVDKVVEVYERAVLAVTYSVDIWLHYCMFAISNFEDSDTIRRLFERGLAYVGTDYLSYLLWDEYIRYEEAHQNWSRLAMIYTRIFENPIQQLDRYFNCFKELAASRPLSEILTAEEATIVIATVEVGTEGVHDEVHHDDAEESSKPVSTGLQEAEELAKYIAIRENMYKKAKEFDYKIIGFETAIRRPYFHVKPLDDPELDNWHNYLDFIEREDDFNKVVKLYERCLIACANYPKYWVRYVLCMEASGSMELALNALARATQVFVKKQPEIHLFAARFKELNGDFLGARAEYQLLYSEISPCLLEAIVKHANMEYRLGLKGTAFTLYEKAIATEQEKKQSQMLPMLLVQYSRFLSLVTGNVEKAMEVLDGALNRLQLSKPLLEAVIHLNSIQRSPKVLDHLDLLVEKFISQNPDNANIASISDREEISCIFLEFLDLFGDAHSIRKAENRHNMLFLRQKSIMSISKKRKAEDFFVSDKAKLLTTGTVVPLSDQSVLGSYSNVAAWPSTSQAQKQQWNHDFAQQADYSVYALPSYDHPQIPTSAPQAVGYAPYPPTYPVQTYQQQSYVQPTSVAAFPQQPTVAPQQYYGISYY